MSTLGKLPTIQALTIEILAAASTYLLALYILDSQDLYRKGKQLSCSSS